MVRPAIQLHSTKLFVSIVTVASCSCGRYVARPFSVSSRRHAHIVFRTSHSRDRCAQSYDQHVRQLRLLSIRIS